MLKQRGYLMIIVALLLVVITGLASSFVSMMQTGANSSSSAISANVAYPLAYSGIEEGLYQLSLSTANCINSWSASHPVNNQGEVQYKCTPPTSVVSNTLASSPAPGLTSSGTTITLNSNSGFASFGFIQIDSETIYYDSLSADGKSLLNAIRGAGGTSAAAHAAGSSVTQSQYVIQSQAGYPSLTAPSGKVILSQAALLTSNKYFVAGNNSSGYGAILSYAGSWTNALTTSQTLIFSGIDSFSNFGQAVGINQRGNSNNVDSYTSQYSGSIWSALSAKVSKTVYNDISCDQSTSPTICWIVGQQGTSNRLYTTNGTSSYTGTANSTQLNGVSCTGGSCAAVGNLGAYNFSTQASNPGSVKLSLSGLSDVNCPAAGTCLATRNTGRIYYYNGSWGSNANPTTNSLSGVSCPSTTTCFAVGNSGTIIKILLPSLSWTKQTAPGTLDLSDVDCISTSDCLAVSTTSTNQVYKYNGSTWSVVTIPLGSYSLNAVSHATGTGLLTSILRSY